MFQYVPSDITINERIDYILKVKEQENIISRWESLGGLLDNIDDKLNLSLLYEELAIILLDKSNVYHPVLENIAFDLIKYLFQNVDKKINIFLELEIFNSFLNKNYVYTDIDDKCFLHFYLQDFYNLK
jgi:hypothetical protein